MFGWGKTKAALLEQQLESMHSYARTRINTAHERCNAIELRTTVLESGKEFTGEAVTNLAVSLTGIAGRLDAHILEAEKDRDAMNSQIVRNTRQLAEIKGQIVGICDTQKKQADWVAALEEKLDVVEKKQVDPTWVSAAATQAMVQRFVTKFENETRERLKRVIAAGCDVETGLEELTQKLDAHIEQTIKDLSTLNDRIDKSAVLFPKLDETVGRVCERLATTTNMTPQNWFDMNQKVDALSKDVAILKERLDPVERHVSESTPAAASEFGGGAHVPDDNEPITEEWVRAMGFVNANIGSWLVSELEKPGSFNPVGNPVGSFGITPRWAFMDAMPMQLYTRRHFRMACEILGIELKEPECPTSQP